ncbi:MAG TPA: flavin reductase family protein [Vicinamibacterales bacterium]|nr:flavin reductase family protein [Vicinamibacterales bacterium]
MLARDMQSSSHAYITGSVVESPVAILLVKAGNRSNAMTVSFFSEVAHHPTSLWVSIATSTYTHALIEETQRFSLAVLHVKQKYLALGCGSVSGREHDKCSTLEVYETASGFLFLNGALSSTACRVRDRVALSDHTIFIADILEGQIESRQAHLRHLLLSDL